MPQPHRTPLALVVLRGIAVLSAVFAVPVVAGLIAGETGWGIAVGLALVLLALPGVVLNPQRDSRLSLRTIFMLGRWGGGGT